MSDKLYAKKMNSCFTSGWTHNDTDEWYESIGFNLGSGTSRDEFQIVVTPGKLFGHVFKRDSETRDRVEVTDPDQIAKVRALYDEDLAIQSSRHERAKTLAEQLHAGNPQAVEMFKAHLDFNDGDVDSDPLEYNGVVFYQVGRNASHQFFFGMKDGQAYRYSCGEGWEDEETGKWELEELFDPVDDFSGYCGHY